MDMSKDIFAEFSYGQAALKKLAPVSATFRLFSAGWLGENPKDREMMKVTGAEFRMAQAGPSKGTLSVMVKGSKRNAFVSREEIRQFDAAVTAPSAQPIGVKVRCENWFWSRKLQMLLASAIGCKWHEGIEVPWNTRREFLVIQHGKRGWFFSWATDRDFDDCPLKEWSAKALVSAYPG